MGETDRRSAWSEALRILSRRALTTSELRTRLREKGYAEEESATATDRAVERGFLDDERVAARLAERWMVERGYGRTRARREMRRRLLDDERIAAALDALEHANPELEDRQLRRSVREWVRRNGEPDTDAARGRLFGHLQRRGFRESRIRSEILDR